LFDLLLRCPLDFGAALTHDGGRVPAPGVVLDFDAVALVWPPSAHDPGDGLASDAEQPCVLALSSLPSQAACRSPECPRDVPADQAPQDVGRD